jgi:2-oxoglutarate dehydrogenase E1 component
MALQDTPQIGSLATNLEFIDEVYARYLTDPASVDPSWRNFFETGVALIGAATGGTNGHGAATTNGHANGGNGHAGVATAAAALYAPAVRESAIVESRLRPPPIDAGPTPAVGFVEAKAGRLFGLVHAYRARGHLEARLDPLDHQVRPPYPDLDPRTWGFTDADLDTVMPAGGMFGVEQTTLRELLARLRATYCGSIGVEMMHILDGERRVWLTQRMESSLNRAPLDKNTQLFIYERLAAAEVFENFVHTKYVGTKRFSLEGGESLIPLLELALERAGIHGVEEAVIGMAHRGRLNVLCNVMGKSAYDIFAEFEDIDPESMFGGGDVKYHLGYSSDHLTRAGNKLHLSLAFNPSHLEAVDPVVVGRVRAKQRRRNDDDRRKVMGILIHGDAAFSGQGLVPETLNLSELRGYRTGGTLHIVVNNQIGFTTSPASSRSTPYCTDIAKEVLLPIFHVNGDDPDAVAQVVRLAMDYRREYKSDVVIDLLCYRKYGHNETDEPSFTQPQLYKKIQRHPTPRQVYGRRLIEAGVMTEAEADAVVKGLHAKLEEDHRRKRTTRPKVSALAGLWSGYAGGPDASTPEVETAISKETLERLGERITTVPPDFKIHPSVAKVLQARQKMARGEQGIDWGMGEHIAFASIVDEGYLVRISGQDSRRGTFSQRHAVLIDQETEAEYTPLEHVRDGQGKFRIYDSPLSEASVLGFEFGYSLDWPDGLCAWEAQFGDFANGAQVIIDQFITSSEDKWNRLSGLVMLLPHGYEGQGPEHSSARLERFLEACAEDNIQVCYPSTPASYFHMLRRQVIRRWRKPLIVMTPKSLLRLPAARSTVEELTTGGFQRILHDPTPPAAEAVRRLLVCTGKIYYDLADERKKRNDATTAIMRLEQLYPLSDGDLKAAIERYAKASEVVWVQEEPRNMGAHGFIMERLRRAVGGRALKGVARAESGSPATGSSTAHKLEQQLLMNQAFSPLDQIP